MLYTADDLRKFTKGRTSFEYSLTSTLEDLNCTMKEQALLGKHEASVTLYVDREHWDIARTTIMKRLTEARLGVSITTLMPTANSDGKMHLQITW